MPFERLVEELEPGATSRAARCSRRCSPSRTAPPALRPAGVDRREVAAPQRHGQVGADSSPWRSSGDGLAGGLEFNADLFDAATARRLADRLRAAPRRRRGRARRRGSATSPCSRRPRSGRSWRNGTRPRRRSRATSGCTSCSRRRRRARRARPPWSHGEERLSYARAGRLGRPAGPAPARPGRRAGGAGGGLLPARTPGMVAALLAVLKAGRRLRAPRSRPIPRTAWPSCSRTPARPCCSPRRGLRRRAAAVRRPLVARWIGIAGGPEAREAAARLRPPRAGGLRHLHLRLDRQAQGRADPPRRRRGAGLAGPSRPTRAQALAGVLAGDLALLRPVGVRDLRAARRRRRRGPGGRRPGAAGPAGRRRGDPGQHRALGHGRAGAGRRACPARCGWSTWPASRCAASWPRGSMRLRGRGGPQPLRPLRGHHLLDRRPGRGAGTSASPPIGRPLAQHPGLRARSGPAAGAGGRRRASCGSAARGWPAATCGRPDLTAERFAPDPFGPARRAGSTAPATWRGCAAGRRARVPRPRSTTR